LPKPSSKAPGQISRRLRETAFLLSVLLAVYLLACLLSYDPMDPGPFATTASDQVNNIGRVFGAWLANFFLFLTGYIGYLLPVAVVYAGWRIHADSEHDGEGQLTEWVIRISGFVLFVLSSTGLAYLHAQPPVGRMPAGGGGVFGQQVAAPMLDMTGMLGATLFLLSMMLVGVTLFTGVSWFRVMDVIGKYTLAGANWLWASILGLRDWFAGRRARARREEVRKADTVRRATKQAPKIEPQMAPEPPKKSKRVAKEKQRVLFENLPEGALPPLDLLDDPPEQVQGYSKEALEALSKQVEIKLADFGVQVDVVEVHPGPVITRFELQPAPGVKSAQISNLAKDLARGLSVTSVRVVEVIPGKPTIGLEIPNTNKQIVYLSEILRSEVYEKSRSPLTMALGKSIAGRPQVADLAKMPHLLVAGTTGSGKSVALNAMILSLVYKATPDEVRLVMVDPKMLELSIYEGIPHLLAPVVTDMKEAANALRWCVAEMERRYRLMAAMGVRNLAGFNKKVKEAKEAGEPIADPLFNGEEGEEAPDLQPLPYIVVIIDELADMMMIVGKKVDELIARLAQKARASGIHLVLATQRPSVDVITGLIKANVPSRIAFQVSSRVDSRTILDQMGAEQLLGHGDMLYLPPGTAIPDRVHGAFVDDHEVHAIVEYLQKFGEPDYIEEILSDTQMTADGMSINAAGLPEDTSAAGGEQDALYDQAVAWVTESRRASISSVQRQLRIGYNRAARLIEDMEAAGIVSPPEHNGQREVLAPPPPKP